MDPRSNRHPSPREPLVLLGLTLLALLVSALAPYDRATWWMEVAPVLIALPILLVTWRGFPLTPLLYRLIFLHALVLLLGGYYTYARVPVGFWVQDLFDLGRNHYDRLGTWCRASCRPWSRARSCCAARRSCPASGSSSSSPA